MKYVNVCNVKRLFTKLKYVLQEMLKIDLEFDVTSDVTVSFNQAKRLKLFNALETLISIIAQLKQI